MYNETVIGNLKHAIRNVKKRQPDKSWVSPYQTLKAEHPDRQFLRDWNKVPLDWVTARRAQNLNLGVYPEPVGYLYDGFWVYPLYEVVK